MNYEQPLRRTTRAGPPPEYVESFKNSAERYQCVHCDRSYLHFKHLKRHFMKHTGSRPHVCSICQDTFCRSDILKRHYARCLQKFTATGKCAAISRVPKRIVTTSPTTPVPQQVQSLQQTSSSTAPLQLAPLIPQQQHHHHHQIYTPEPVFPGVYPQVSTVTATAPAAPTTGQHYFTQHHNNHHHPIPGQDPAQQQQHPFMASSKDPASTTTTPPAITLYNHPSHNTYPPPQAHQQPPLHAPLPPLPAALTPPGPIPSPSKPAPGIYTHHLTQGQQQAPIPPPPIISSTGVSPSNLPSSAPSLSSSSSSSLSSPSSASPTSTSSPILPGPPSSTYQTFAPHNQSHQHYYTAAPAHPSTNTSYAPTHLPATPQLPIFPMTAAPSPPGSEAHYPYHQHPLQHNFPHQQQPQQHLAMAAATIANAAGINVSSQQQQQQTSYRYANMPARAYYPAQA